MEQDLREKVQKQEDKWGNVQEQTQCRAIDVQEGDKVVDDDVNKPKRIKIQNITS